MVLVIGGVSSYAIWGGSDSNDFNEKTNKEGGVEKPQSEDGTKLKADGTPIPTAGGVDASVHSQADVTINSASVFEGNLMISTNVGNATSGTCTAILKKDGNSDVTKSSNLVLITSYYACQVITVPTSSFPATGEWELTVNFSGDNKSGVSTVQKVVIN